MTVIPATIFDPPVTPALPYGLYQHVEWVSSGDPARFLVNDGVVIRPRSFDADGFGAWEAGWCADPQAISEAKEGDRPDIDLPTPFEPETVFGFDRNYCGDLSAQSRQEVRDRALENLTRMEQIAAERQFADRLNTDAGTPPTATSLRDAIATLEEALAKVGVSGFIHMSPGWVARDPEVFVVDGSGGVKTVLGTTVVIGGGYAHDIPWRLFATSQVYGWRGSTQINEATEHETNQFIAVAERSVLLGYEKLIAAVKF